jgi:hypothetical protein
MVPRDRAGCSDVVALGDVPRRAILAIMMIRASVVPSVFTATALWLVATAAGAQAPLPGPGWVSDMRTGCRVWNANAKPNLTVSWSGPCQNRVAQGHGVLQWFTNNRPGDRYEGDVVSGKYDGRGSYISADGFRYDGEWRDGKANGHGELTTKTGSFSGMWADGCFRDGERRAWVGVAAASCG